MSTVIESLSAEAEATLEKNLVWVCATGRSGSTWLARQLLGKLPYYINEPEFCLHLGVTTRLDSDRIPIRALDSRIDPNYFFGNEYEDVWTYYLRRLVLYRVYAQFQDYSKRVVIKEAAMYDASDVLSKCFPQSKMILLVRDGRDVIDSLIDARTENGWAPEMGKIRAPEKRRTLIVTRSRAWVAVTENQLNTYQQFSDGTHYLVKYEDLRHDTLEQVRKIYNFLDFDLPQRALEKLVTNSSFENIPAEKKGPGKRCRSANPGQWQQTFSEQEQALMNRIMGPTLKKLGYQ